MIYQRYLFNKQHSKQHLIFGKYIYIYIYNLEKLNYQYELQVFDNM